MRPRLHLCCHGLFDVLLPDALLVSEAVAALPEQVRAGVDARARLIQARILEAAPELKPPYFLHGISEQRIDHPCAVLLRTQE